MEEEGIKNSSRFYPRRLLSEAENNQRQTINTGYTLSASRQSFKKQRTESCIAVGIHVGWKLVIIFNRYVAFVHLGTFLFYTLLLEVLNDS